MAIITPAAIAEGASCYASCMSGKLLQAAVVYLLASGAWGGGGGGGGLAFSPGHGAPEGVVVGSPGDTYWDLDTGFEYTKVTGVATNTGWFVH